MKLLPFNKLFQQQEDNNWNKEEYYFFRFLFFQFIQVLKFKMSINLRFLAINNKCLVTQILILIRVLHFMCQEFDMLIENVF